MTRVYTKIGDVFSVKLDNVSKKYFQLIAFDLTQLNSDVIRAFEKVYPIDANPDLSEIVNGEVQFYAHCVTNWGVKKGYWEKVGNYKHDLGDFSQIIFRDSGDYGTPSIKISEKWWVWRINEEQKFIGKLEGKNRKAEIGIIMDPDSIVHRMRTGEYDGFYPGFE